jgi:hypothetical protein
LCSPSGAFNFGRAAKLQAAATTAAPEIAGQEPEAPEGEDKMQRSNPFRQAWYDDFFMANSSGC